MSSLGNKKIMSENIKKYMEQAGVTATDICSTLKIPMPTFSDWINAKTYPRIDKIEMLANYFGILKSDLVEDKSYFSDNKNNIAKSFPDAIPIDFHNLRRIPILGRISAGMPIYAAENIEGYTYTDLNHGGEYFALRVKGDSMDAARIADGDIVIVRKQDIVEDGEIAVVLIDMQDATMKRFYHNGSSITLMPQSTNPAHKPQIYDLTKTNVTVLGKVVKVEFMMD